MKTLCERHQQAAPVLLSPQSSKVLPLARDGLQGLGKAWHGVLPSMQVGHWSLTVTPLACGRTLAAQGWLRAYCKLGSWAAPWLHDPHRPLQGWLRALLQQ